MTNTEASHNIELARSLVAAGESAAQDRKADHDFCDFRDWQDADLARLFSAVLGSVKFWHSPDGREVHCSMNGTNFSHLTSELLDAACSRVYYPWHDDQRIEEVAPGHDVLYLW